MPHRSCGEVDPAATEAGIHLINESHPFSLSQQLVSASAASGMK